MIEGDSQPGNDRGAIRTYATAPNGIYKLTSSTETGWLGHLKAKDGHIAHMGTEAAA